MDSYDLPDVALKRPVFHAELGRRLRGCRLARRLSVRQVVNLTKGKVSPAQINWLERGQTRLPAPEVLEPLATLYALNYDELVKEFLTAIYGEYLTTASNKGTPDANHADDDEFVVQQVSDSKLTKLEPSIESAPTDSSRPSSSGGDDHGFPGAIQIATVVADLRECAAQFKALIQAGGDQLGAFAAMQDRTKTRKTKTAHRVPGRRRKGH